jgi:hypothetical protein
VNQIAKEMNETLSKNSKIFFDFLSDFGKRIYMPKGILVQSAEAKLNAKKYNATIGISREKDAPMYLPSLMKYFNNLKPSEIFDYAPAYGVPELRNKWRKKIIDENKHILNSPEQISTP